MKMIIRFYDDYKIRNLEPAMRIYCKWAKTFRGSGEKTGLGKMCPAKVNQM